MSRERRVEEGTIARRTSDKFIDQSMDELDLWTTKEAPSPTTKDLQKLEGDPLGPEEAGLFRTVACRLLRVMEDNPAEQYTVKEHVREAVGPTAGTLSRLKHVVRYLEGRRAVV